MRSMFWYNERSQDLAQNHQGWRSFISSLALLNIKSDLSNKIDSEVIVNKFAEQDRRIVLK